MAYLIGIDVGTSSLKTLIMSENGDIAAVASRNYHIDSPQAGYAQQHPAVWWNACKETISQTLAESKIAPQDIKAIGFSGQMHGLVPLDEKYALIRPAILHCDVRSASQVREIEKKLGPSRIRSLIGNPVYTGFLLPSLLWMRENEPKEFERIRHVCLPKDYIKYRLCGILSSDWSDASATLAFDVSANSWSEELFKLFDLPKEIFPPCFNTYTPVGTLCKEAAAETGLMENTLVVAGGGDQIMQGIGNGAIDFDSATINIGSSGQVSFQSDKPIVNPALCTNTFAGYEKGRWIVMGAIMQAGLALKWFSAIAGGVSYEQLDAMAREVQPGSGGVIFLPYLNGERTPHINSQLSASFTGCNMKTGQAEMGRAVMEGVAYALRECMEICEGIGLHAKEVIASGGGARSEVWLQIQSDIYGLPLKLSKNEEQACIGAAIAAGTGCGMYKDIEQGCKRAIRFQERLIVPNMKNHALYEDYYALFKSCYPAERELLERATRLGKKSV